MVAEIGFAETRLSLTLKIAVLDNRSKVVSLKWHVLKMVRSNDFRSNDARSKRSPRYIRPVLKIVNFKIHCLPWCFPITWVPNSERANN